MNVRVSLASIGLTLTLLVSLGWSPPARAVPFAIATSSATIQFTCTGTQTDKPPPVLVLSGTATSSALVAGTQCGTGDSVGAGAFGSANVRSGKLGASAAVSGLGSGAGGGGDIVEDHLVYRNFLPFGQITEIVAVITGSTTGGSAQTASGNWFSGIDSYIEGEDPSVLSNSWGFTHGVVIHMIIAIPANGRITLPSTEFHLSAGACCDFQGGSGVSATFNRTATLYMVLPDGVQWERDPSDEFLADRTDAILRPGDPIPTGEPSASAPEPATLMLFAVGLAGLGFSRRKRIAN